MTHIVELTLDDREEAEAILAASFCGSTTTAPEGVLSFTFGTWDIGGDDSGDCFGPLPQEPSAYRKAFFQWNAAHSFAKCVQAGKVFGVRENGSLLGVCCCVAPLGPSEDVGSIDRAASEQAGAPPWMPPRSEDNGMQENWRLVRRRLAAAAETTRSIHHDCVPGPHWYLASLATTPAAQGKGVGKALLNHLHAICDAQQLPCYLETIGARNEGIYERVGYACKLKRVIKPGKSMRHCDWNGGAAGMVRLPMPRAKL